ncbi:hypothetical protein E4V15_09620 [Proteus mirabilis]|nr:hypothetical protein E4V15_09620 [Proteus mirabilis]
MSAKLTRKKLAFIGVIIALIAVYFLFIQKPKVEYLPGNLHGFNHVKGTSVNWFKVNGNYGRGAMELVALWCQENGHRIKPY